MFNFDDLKEYLSNVSKIKPLLPDEERELIKKLESGDQVAKRELAEANMSLVPKLIDQYLPQLIEKMIENGNLQLFRSVEKYDSNKGPYQDYAKAWIEMGFRKMIKKMEESDANDE